MPFDGTQNIVAVSLRLAKEVIADEKSWCKCAVFDRDGRHCAVGAVLKVVNYKHSADLINNLKYLDSAARARGYYHVSKFNDAPHVIHADVLALYDEAIALAEAGDA